MPNSDTYNHSQEHSWPRMYFNQSYGILLNTLRIMKRPNWQLFPIGQLRGEPLFSYQRRGPPVHFRRRQAREALPGRRDHHKPLHPGSCNKIQRVTMNLTSHIYRTHFQLPPSTASLTPGLSWV